MGLNVIHECDNCGKKIPLGDEFKYVSATISKVRAEAEQDNPMRFDFDYWDNEDQVQATYCEGCGKAAMRALKKALKKFEREAEEVPEKPRWRLVLADGSEVLGSTLGEIDTSDRGEVIAAAHVLNTAGMSVIVEEVRG